MNDKIESKTNTLEQWNMAAEMLGIKDKDFLGGIERCGFSLETLSALLEIGFILFEYKCNNTPTIKVFYEFGKRAEEHGATVEYMGFLESKYRDGASLIIEGVQVVNSLDSAALILDFSQTFHKADDFTANAELLRAWYD